MWPSALMVTDDSTEDATPAEFTWHCEKGLGTNIQLVKNEFCDVNHLKPIKIFVTGPPLSGKSHFSKKLSEEYNIPHIQIKNLINDIKKLDPESELFNKLKEWKDHHPHERFPNYLLCELVQKWLNDNDCQNWGFVLDGFPWTYEDAKGVFYHTLVKKEKVKPVKAEGEGEGDEEPPVEEDEEEEDPEKYKPKF